MSIFRPKKNILFEAAKSKVLDLKNAFVDGLKKSLEQNKFFKIIPNDPNSPFIMGMGENKHLIYYPKNSTPYIHQYENSIKKVQIIDGKIYDKLTDKVYSIGDIIKIYPGEKFQPYTKNEECYVQVCVKDYINLID
jgi:archaellum component FlaG (FlaF/FlaG flagellin family)